MKNLKMHFGSAILSVLVGGSVYAADTTPKTSSTLNQGSSDAVIVEYYGVVLERLEKDTVDFSFPKGSADLTAQQKASLDTMVPTINSDKNIERVIVVAWSDKPYPSAKGQKLSDAERKLAEKRAENIQKYLKDKNVSNVDVFNMAEQPTWIAKTFHTDDAQYKGANDKMDGKAEEKIRNVIESKGGPSKAIVFFQRDWKNKGMGT